MLDPAKAYRWLLKIFPARFREEYQAPMERQFCDEYRDTHDRRGRARLWVHVIWDLVTSAPREIARELGQDLRYALRAYRSRSFSAMLAIIALGLAIGASTGVFSVLNALLLRNLPFSDPERLVELGLSPVGVLNGRAAFTEWREHSPYLGDAAVFIASEMNLNDGREALRLKVAETSSNFFTLLGTKIAWGRTFAADEEIPGQAHVAVISHSLWQQSFGGDPRALGATLHLNGTPLTIIGIAPPRFDYPGNTSIWLPSVFDIESVPKRGAFFPQTIGRLKAGVSMRQAHEMFEAELRRLDPKSLDGDAQNRARLILLRNQLAGSVREATWVLSGIVLFILLAACANVAQLLLSRTTERRQELALRAALGASRARLAQQLITEATGLTITGAAGGLLVAHWASRIASWVAPPQLATQEYTILDWRVLGFAAGLTIVIGILFGAIPSWLVGRLQPTAQLLHTQPGTRDPAMSRMRAGLLALQAALTLTLVAGSLTMGRAFLKLLGTDLGFRPGNVVTLNVSLQGAKPRTNTAEGQYYRDALNRLRFVPGVEAAGAVSHLPLGSDAYMAASMKLDSGQQVQNTIMNAASPDYFKAIGTRVLVGREFLAGEGQKTEPPVIVNDAFARQAGLGSSIVGRRLISPWNERSYLIVGVVDTARFAGPAHPGTSEVYWPIEEESPPFLTLVARVRGQAENYLATCRDTIRSLDQQVSVYGVKTLDQRLDEVLARPRFYTTATLFFAGLAVLLAVIGIYGAASYSVAQRRHEMGVRMALGASHAKVRWMVIRQSLVPISLGIIAGIAGAIISGRYLEYLIVGARPLELPNCATASAFLLVTAVTAALSATGRILSINPVDALRAE